jgi:hypothetical protein
MLFVSEFVVSLFNLLLYVLGTGCCIYMLVCLSDLTTSDLYPAIILATTAHSFHVGEQRIFTI